jgi:hypothetical protein
MMSKMAATVENRLENDDRGGFAMWVLPALPLCRQMVSSADFVCDAPQYIDSWESQPLAMANLSRRTAPTSSFRILCQPDNIRRHFDDTPLDMYDMMTRKLCFGIAFAGLDD